MQQNVAQPARRLTEGAVFDRAIAEVEASQAAGASLAARLYELLSTRVWTQLCRLPVAMTSSSRLGVDGGLCAANPELSLGRLKFSAVSGEQSRFGAERSTFSA